VEHPKVVNVTIAFAEVVKVNRQQFFKVGGSLAKLLHTWLDGDNLIRRCKGLQV